MLYALKLNRAATAMLKTEVELECIKQGSVVILTHKWDYGI